MYGVLQSNHKKMPSISKSNDKTAHEKHIRLCDLQNEEGNENKEGK